jgi:hypothetical protein
MTHLLSVLRRRSSSSPWLWFTTPSRTGKIEWHTIHTFAVREYKARLAEDLGASLKGPLSIFVPLGKVTHSLRPSLQRGQLDYSLVGDSASQIRCPRGQLLPIRPSDLTDPSDLNDGSTDQQTIASQTSETFRLSRSRHPSGTSNHIAYDPSPENNAVAWRTIRRCEQNPCEPHRDPADDTHSACLSKTL